MKDDVIHNNPNSALLIKSFSGIHSYPILDIGISNDNSKFASCGMDRLCFYYDVATGQVIKRIPAHSQKINAVSLNTDATVLLTASDDKTLKAWDLRSNMKDPIQVMDQFKDSVTCIDQTSSQNSSQIGAGSVDGCVYAFDMRSGLLNIDNIKSPITSIQYSANQKTILATCLGSILRLLSVESGQILQEYYGGHIHESFKVQSVFSCDNSTILCASENNNSICLYDFLSSKVVAKKKFNFVVDNKKQNSSKKSVSVLSLAHHPQLPFAIAGSTDGATHVFST